MLQADLSPQEAVALWPDVKAQADAYGMGLVSPAVNYCGTGCVTQVGWRPRDQQERHCLGSALSGPLRSSYKARAVERCVGIVTAHNVYPPILVASKTPAQDPFVWLDEFFELCNELSGGCGVTAVAVHTYVCEVGCDGRACSRVD